MQTVQEKQFEILDAHFSNEFDVKKVPSERWYLRGIHRTFIYKPSKFCFSVYYHLDNRRAPSGAYLVKKENGHAGWVYLTHAQVIVYAIPSIEAAYLITGFNLKQSISKWSETEYNKSEAYLIPFSLFSEISYKQEFISWAQTATD